MPVTVRGACSSLPCALGELAPGELREVIATLSPPADYAGPPTLVVRSVAVSDPFDPRPEKQCRQRRDDAHAGRRSVDHQDRADNCRSWSASDLCGHGRQCRTFCRDRGQRGRSDSGRIDVGINERRLHDRLPVRSGTMPPGTTRTIAATYTVAGGTAAPPEITNTATVLSGVSDPNPANNRATISTRIRIRTTCDVDGDGVDEIVTGAGPGGGPHVRAFRFAAGSVTEIASFYAYDPAFGGGVFVACGDVDGDGLADIITGAGRGGAPHVRAFGLAGGNATELASFYAYNPSFAGGVTVAVADVDGDGLGDIVTGAGPTGGPHVRAFSLAGSGATELVSFFAYDPTFVGGVFVASADMTGDGRAEIITGTTREGGPVRVFSIGGPGQVTEFASFFPYVDGFRGPVRVAAADVDGDGQPDIVSAAGPGGGPHVRALSLAGGVLTELASFFAYDSAVCDLVNGIPVPAGCDGVYVGGADVTGDGVAEIITGTNQAAGPLRVFQVPTPGTVSELTNFFPYFSAFRGSVRVAPWISSASCQPYWQV